jgi:hypothetical protein
MIKIAHRGNYHGIDRARENTIAYIEEAIVAGYDVEIDVWLLEKKWYLGHDMPGEEIPLSFMERPQIWTHAKDLQGYVSLYNNPKVHTFWHNLDEFVFTSKGIKWASPGVRTYDGIMVLPERVRDTWPQIIARHHKPLGVCSDDFTEYENSL